jgi:hypothetical protein
VLLKEFQPLAGVLGDVDSRDLTFFVEMIVPRLKSTVCGCHQKFVSAGAVGHAFVAKRLLTGWASIQYES